jgi:hypothetical protein
VLGRATGNSDTQDSPRPKLWGSHHLPPYSILCSSPRRPHPNDFLSWDSQVGVLKFQQLGLPQLRRRITSSIDLRSQWGLKQSCSPSRELPMVCRILDTHWGRVDSRLLVVGSQTVNLTIGLSFCHNLCWRCPNGSCKPIFDNYTLIAFQWYKERFNARCFDPYNWTLKSWESRWTPNPHFGSEGVILSLFQSRVATKNMGGSIWLCTQATLKFETWLSLHLNERSAHMFWPIGSPKACDKCCWPIMRMWLWHCFKILIIRGSKSMSFSSILPN